jgi:hypothetical protein
VGSRWAWNAGGPSSAHSSRGAAAGKGKATLDLGPNEVRTEQPGCYVVRQLSLYLCSGYLCSGYLCNSDMSWPMAVLEETCPGAATKARARALRLKWVHERAQALNLGPGRRPPHRRMDTIGRWSVQKKLGSRDGPCKFRGVFCPVMGRRFVVNTRIALEASPKKMAAEQE